MTVSSAWAEPYIGLRYAAAGRSLERPGAVDCIGLYLGVVHRQAHIALPEYDGPPWKDARTVKDLGEAAEAFARRFEQVPSGQERCFDAVLMKMRRQPIHIGCVVEPGLMLHIEEGCDSVIEQYRTMHWNKRIVGFYRPSMKQNADLGA